MVLLHLYLVTAREIRTAPWNAGMGVVGVALAAAISLYVYRALAPRRQVRALAKRIASLPPAQIPEGAVSLAGTVEVDDPETPAISVYILQRCDDGSWRKAGWRTMWMGGWAYWDERARTVEAGPFTLVLNGSHARIRVVSDAEVHLCANATITRTELVGSKMEQHWNATLRHGERVVVTGVLSPDSSSGDGGYRDPSRALILCAPEGGRLRVEAEGAAQEIMRTAPRFAVGRACLLFATFSWSATVAGSLLADVTELNQFTMDVVMPAIALFFFTVSYFMEKYNAPGTWQPWYDRHNLSGPTYK